MKRFLLVIISIGFISEIVHAQSPGGVATDNTVWLKANSGVTLNPSNQVSSWAELSGAAVTGNFSTHNPGAGGVTQLPPTILQSGVNFNPYLVFVNTNPNCISSDNLINGNAIFGTQQMTIFQVINLHQSVGTGVWCKWQAPSNTSPGRIGNETPPGSGQIRLDFKGGNAFSVSNVLNKHTLFTGVANSTNNLIIRLSGNQDASINVFGTNNQPGTARLALGNDNEVGVDPYPTTIDIAEFILYSRELSPAEINKVESYLAVKYGMTLVQTGANPNDYTSSNGTIIWDNSANAPYYNNITGIGTDDYGVGSSALQQRQSLSINPDAIVTMYNGVYPSGVFPTTNDENTNSVGIDNTAFLLFGDNMGDTLLSVCGENGVARTGRVWKVQKTGTVNDVTLAIKNTVLPSAQTLLVSNDPTFTTGVTAIPLSNNGTSRYASYNFNNNQYFAFGSVGISLNPTITDALCADDNASITLAPTGGVAPYTYSWNTTPPQTGATATNLTTGSYTVTVTQGNGCTYTESFTVSASVIDMEVDVKTDSAQCTADNGRATVNVQGGTPPYTYALDGSATFNSSNIIESLPSGSHSVTIKDANGCEKSMDFEIGHKTYDLMLSIITDSSYCDRGGQGGSIEVNVDPIHGTFPYTYKWIPFDGVNERKLSNVDAGDYSVTVIDDNGCESTISGTVGEIPCCKMLMPTAFTPNGDGMNDYYKPNFSGTTSHYKLSIYNRWGQLLYDGFEWDKGWDGTYDGKKADPGTYLYNVTYICVNGNIQYETKGDLTLLR